MFARLIEIWFANLLVIFQLQNMQLKKIEEHDNIKYSFHNPSLQYN